MGGKSKGPAPVPDRKDPRVVVLRRIISLKRRCNRCYLINVPFSLITLIVQANALVEFEEHLFQNEQFDLLDAMIIYVASATITLVGSVSGIYAMTQKFKKWTFLLAKLLMTSGVLLAILAVVGFHFFFPKNPDHNYGYPQMYIEDCEAYPDHTFRIIEFPTQHKGRPLPIFTDVNLEFETEKEAEERQRIKIRMSDEIMDAYLEVTTTEETTIYETYPCQTILKDIKRHIFLWYFMCAYIVVIMITLIISYMNVCYLWCLQYSKHLIILPSDVEPYNDYDNLLLAAIQADNPEVQEQDRDEDLEAKRQDFVTLNMDMDFKVGS